MPSTLPADWVCDLTDEWKFLPVDSISPTRTQMAVLLPPPTHYCLIGIQRTHFHASNRSTVFIGEVSIKTWSGVGTGVTHLNLITGMDKWQWRWPGNPLFGVQ